MASYRDLLKQVKSEIDEIDVPRLAELLGGKTKPVVVDVRDRNEWDEGYIPGAVHVPRANLESRIEAAVPDRTAPIVLYCASGSRSAFAARSLGELGYEDAASLAGGFAEWKRAGLPFDIPRALDPARRARYSRHLLIPEVGE
jgi:adenylyltransferase/sulfurtransferase